MTNEDLFAAIMSLKDAMNISSEKNETRFVSINKRFDSVDQRFDRLEGRFDRLETRVENLEDGQKAIRSDIAGLTRRLR